MAWAAREARRRSHAGSGQASAVYAVDRAVVLGRCGRFAQVSGGKHGDILLQPLVFVNFAAGFRIDHGHLSLDATLLGEKLFVLTGFPLGLRYVSTRHGRNVWSKLFQRNDNSQRTEAINEQATKKALGVSPSRNQERLVHVLEKSRNENTRLRFRIQDKTKCSTKTREASQGQVAKHNSSKEGNNEEEQTYGSDLVKCL